MEELMKIDLYDLLEITTKADNKEIKKAYRKKALSCHPDKNPDNPKAGEIFQQLSKALEILTDSAARAAYDKILKARKENEIRNRALDSKRKKLKEDLEAREKAAQEFKQTDSTELLEKEVERLRREGSKQLEVELELMRKVIEKERLDREEESYKYEKPRLKAVWKIHPDETKVNYTQESISEMFQQYGDVTCVVSLKSSRGRAVIEFSSMEAARAAFHNEKGSQKNPIELSFIGSNEKKQDLNVKSKNVTSSDYESIVLMKLRQAEERKRLIQQMKDDEE